MYVEDVEDVQMYMYLFQEDNPDKNKSWFELGADIGLEIVDDDEVEAEVDEIEANEEVARIYEDAKQCHRKIMTPMGLNEINTVNGTHVKDVEDTVYTM